MEETFQLPETMTGAILKALVADHPAPWRVEERGLYKGTAVIDAAGAVVEEGYGRRDLHYRTVELVNSENLYRRAVDLVVTGQNASASFVQRHLRIGYIAAVRLLDRMVLAGIVTAPDRVGKRAVLKAAP